MSGREEAETGEEDAGEVDETGLARDDGLLVRSLAHLFARMAQQAAGGGAPRFRARCSYVEIYNEAVYDLLSPGAPPQLPVKWDGAGFHAPGCRRVVCETLDDALRCIVTGARNRTVGSHELNGDSSRSHSICTLHVEAARPGAAGQPAQLTCGKVSFVDLAGSERLKASKSAGVMASETGSINRSLMALGKVISALSEGGGRAAGAHVPYRDSKLTKLLMDSLGGSSLALFIACCSPAGASVEETLSTLTYATRAKNIVNAPAQPQAPQAASDVDALRRELGSLREENHALRAALQQSLDDAAVAAAAAAADAGGPVAFLHSPLASSFVRLRPPPFPTLAPPSPSPTQRSASPSREVGTAGAAAAAAAAAEAAAEAAEQLAQWQAQGREALLAALAEASGAAAAALAENGALKAEAAAALDEARSCRAKLKDLEAVFLASGAEEAAGRGEAEVEAGGEDAAAVEEVEVADAVHEQREAEEDPAAEDAEEPAMDDAEEATPQEAADNE